MRRFIASIWVVAAVAAGGSHAQGNEFRPIPSGGIESLFGADGSMADILPGDTQGYFRMANVEKVRRGFVQEAHITDAAAVERAFDELLETAFIRWNGADDGFFGSSGETMYACFNGARSIHLAMVPSKTGWDFDGPGGNAPEFEDRVNPVFIVELDSMNAVDAHLKEAAGKIQTKEIKGHKVYTRSRNEWQLDPEAVCKLDDHTLVIAFVDTALDRILETKSSGRGSLSQNGDFREAYQKLGLKHDLFVYVSFDAIRSTEREVPALLSSLSGYADLGGEATLRFRSNVEFPEFLRSNGKPKQFLKRIPAEAAVVLDGTFHGGKQVREALVARLENELKAEGGLLHVLGPGDGAEVKRMLEAATGDPADIDPEYVWAAIPIKSELAWFAAPLSNGKWGMAAICDIDDRAKAEKLAEKVKEAAKKAPVPIPWETKTVGGTTIHFFDVTKLAPPGAIPDDVKQALDFRVGYAVNDELLVVGTVGAIEFALEPSGSTYADRIEWKGVDRENVAVLSVPAGAIAQAKVGIPKVDAVLERIAREIPRNASYTATLDIGQTEATLRSNVPLSSLIGWLTVEFATDEGPAKLKEVVDP